MIERVKLTMSNGQTVEYDANPGFAFSKIKIAVQGFLSSIEMDLGGVHKVEAEEEYGREVDHG